MRKLTVNFLVIILILLFTTTPILAQNDTQIKLPNQKIYPGALNYPVKRVWEKIREKIASSGESKISLYKELTLTRMAELDYVISNKHLGEFQTSNERFSFYAGKLTESASNSDKSKKDEIKNDFENYLKRLEQLKQNFDYESSYWMLIEHSINSLRSYWEKLS